MSRREELRLRDIREAITTLRGHIASGEFEQELEAVDSAAERLLESSGP